MQRSFEPSVHDVVCPVFLRRLEMSPGITFSVSQPGAILAITMRGSSLISIRAVAFPNFCLLHAESFAESQ